MPTTTHAATEPDKLASGPEQPIQEVVKHREALFRGRELIALGAGVLILFILIMLAVLFLNPLAFDVPVTRAIQQINFPLFDHLMVAVSAPGYQPWNLIVPTVLIAGLALIRRVAEAAFLAVAAIATTSDELVKALIQRPRPTDALVNVTQNLNSYSFPSGHVTEYTLVFGFCFYLAFTLMPPGALRLLILFLTGAMVVLVGPSRIWLGEHWTSDVVGGYTLGFGLLLLVIWGYRAWESRHLAERRDLPEAG